MCIQKFRGDQNTFTCNIRKPNIPNFLWVVYCVSLKTDHLIKLGLCQQREKQAQSVSVLVFVFGANQLTWACYSSMLATSPKAPGVKGVPGQGDTGVAVDSWSCYHRCFLFTFMLSKLGEGESVSLSFLLCSSGDLNFSCRRLPRLTTKPNNTFHCLQLLSSHQTLHF